MSVIQPKTRYQCRITMSKSLVDMIFGFLSGAISMSIVALVVGITHYETQSVSIWGFALAIGALLTLLLLRGVPINRIKVRDIIEIDFELRGPMDSQNDKDTKEE